MSENFHIYCPTCREGSDTENHGKEKFVAVTNSKAFDILRLARKNGVTIYEIEVGGWFVSSELLNFFKDHLDCPKLIIRSEYFRTPDIEVEVCPKFGCFCDLEPHMEPDDCVIDRGDFDDCIYAKQGMKKEDCKYWQKIHSKGANGHCQKCNRW